jgi:hypothetical protein
LSSYSKQLPFWRVDRPQAGRPEPHTPWRGAERRAQIREQRRVSEGEEAGPVWRRRDEAYAVLSSCRSPRVLAQLQAVREAHARLLQRAESRGEALREQLHLYQLEQEALLLDAWLTTKLAVAESQDYGQDLAGIKVG